MMTVGPETIHERESGSFILDSQKKPDCRDEALLEDARKRGAIDLEWTKQNTT
jgi:hypothetical protein